MKTKSGFPWRNFLRNLAVIAIPVALQNLLTTTSSMVDTMMIAPLGETSVGAVGLCAQFSSLMFSGYWGFVGGGMLFFSQYWGAKDEDGIDRSFGLTLVCMLASTSIFTCLALLAPELVMSIYTDKTAIQAIGVEYLSIDEMYVGITQDQEEFRVPLASFALERWGKQVTYHERLKESYYILQDYWSSLDP